MNADLHVHTRHSTGSSTVQETLLAAREHNLDCISITDRNTTAGVAEALRLGHRFDLTIVPGVEISAHDPETGRGVSLLGYRFELPARNIEALCEPLRRLPGESTPTVIDAIKAVRADGGLAVIAHAGLYDDVFLDRLVSHGLDGLELYSAKHNADDHARIVRVASRHNLFLTGGSNSHEAGNYPAIGDIRAPFDSVHAVLPRHDEEVEWTINLVREAGRIARLAACGDMEAKRKNNDIRDLVTHHDVAVERHLTTAIQARFPDHAFITEEHEHTPPDPDSPTWIIDPIDGTTNFVSSGNYFAVSVAHFHGEQPQFGIVYDVMADDMYVGIRGKGAYLNRRRLGKCEEVTELENAVVEASLITNQRLHEWYGADPKLLATGVRAQRANGSAAIGVCRIARGTIDAYVSTSLSLWDYAAALVILTETGGAAAIARNANATGQHAVGPASDGTARESGGWFHDDRRPFFAASRRETVDELLRRLFPDGPPATIPLGPFGSGG